MSNLVNQNWIGFDGTPITGRVPPELIVYGPPLTGPQLSEVSHTYKLFTDANLLAVGEYQVRNRKLADGTVVRCVSIGGRDTVFVWTTGKGSGDLKLPHGFAVATPWTNPTIYGKGIDGAWDEIVPAPQLVAHLPVSVSQTERVVELVGEDARLEILPHVVANQVLWDWWRHGASETAAWNLTPIPVASYSEHGSILRHSTAYAQGRSILAIDGSELYTAESIDDITVDGEHDVSVTLVANIDTSGADVLLNFYKWALISPSFEIYEFRFCNEVVPYAWSDGVSTIALGEATRSESEPIILSPATVHADQVYSVIKSDIDRPGETYAKLDYYYIKVDGVAWNGWVCRGVSEASLLEFDAESGAEINDVALYRDILIDGTDGLERPSAFALPGDSSGYLSALKIRNSYRTASFHRGGYKDKQLRTGAGAARYWAYNRRRFDRRDVDVLASGDPRTTVDLGWTELVLFEGVSEGRTTGKKYFDTYLRTVVIGYQDTNPEVKRFYYTALPYSPDICTKAGANNFNPDVLAVDTAFGGEGVHSATENEVFEAAENTVQYSFTSRYVIDNDVKARFYAAIKVVAECSGYERRNVDPAYPWIMIDVVPPTYTLTISLEWNWNGVVREKVLTTQTVSRPGFEFERIVDINVWLWPAIDPFSQFIRYEPPKVCFSPYAFDQLQYLFIHQGVNEHFAGHQFRDDKTEDMLTGVGVEYSYFDSRSGRETGHTKSANGMLYARTFRIIDFPGALWLCDALKMNAPANPSDPFATDFWHWMPDIAATLSTEFHVELRDGEEVLWSDDLTPKNDDEGAPMEVPDPEDREIGVWQV